MKFNYLLGVAALTAFCAGCVGTAAPTAAATESAEPVLEQLVDPNPFANYGPAMKSDKDKPMAYEWQKKNDAAIAAAADPKVLGAFLETDLAAGQLLAQVKEAYETDPIVMVQIATISQLVMCTKCPKAPKNRARWTAALLAAAKSAPDAYRTLFFLDQLRWCGLADQSAAVRAIGAKSFDKNVKDFANQVATEMSAVQ